MDGTPKNLSEALARVENATKAERYWAIKDLLAQKFAAAVFAAKGDDAVNKALMDLWHRIIQADGDLGVGR